MLPSSTGHPAQDISFPGHADLPAGAAPIGHQPLLAVHRLPTNQGLAAACNVGLQLAAGMGAGVVLFTDDDCQPDADWVACMLVCWGVASGWTHTACIWMHSRC